MSVSPAAEILVPLLRDNPDFSTLSDPQAWGKIQRVAKACRIAGLVAFTVRPHASPEQRIWCDNVLTDHWAKHDKNVRELSQLAEIFENVGIEVIALKGPVLGRRHFRPAFLRRPSGDIDLAVRSRDLLPAIDELQKWGYVLESSVATATLTSHHVVLTGPLTRRVELHTRLSHGPRGIRVEELFSRSEVHQLPTGKTIRVLSRADELLGLTLHFANDRFSSFFHLYELRLIWKGAGTEARQYVLRTAIAHKFSAVLWLVDTAFRTYWNEPFFQGGDEVPVPQPWLKSWLNAELLSEMEHNIQSTRARTLSLRLRGRWLDLYTTDSAGEALSLIWLTIKVAVREVLLFRWGTIQKGT